MRGLIVNADDFGLSRGVNRGIIEAHARGIVTSTSLMVNTPFSEHAAELSVEHTNLSVGLHATLDAVIGRADDKQLVAVCATELERQVAKFHDLTGCAPVHLDSHHNVHRKAEVAEAFVRVGHEHGLRVREHGEARYVSSFYGQSGGATDLEQISVQGLEAVLRRCDAGVIELGCHPGYVDDDLRSSYRQEREAELRTLCDARVPHVIEHLGFVLLDSRLQPRITPPLTMMPRRGAMR